MQKILYHFHFESVGISHCWPTMQNALKSQQLRVLEPSTTHMLIYHAHKPVLLHKWPLLKVTTPIEYEKNMVSTDVE